jgi:hypothetical protein
MENSSLEAVLLRKVVKNHVKDPNGRSHGTHGTTRPVSTRASRPDPAGL